MTTGNQIPPFRMDILTGPPTVSMGESQEVVESHRTLVGNGHCQQPLEKTASACQDTNISRETLAAAAAKALQSCPTLRDPIDDSPPGSAVRGILQARTLEWGAIAFSKKRQPLHARIQTFQES